MKGVGKQRAILVLPALVLVTSAVTAYLLQPRNESYYATSGLFAWMSNGKGRLILEVVNRFGRPVNFIVSLGGPSYTETSRT